MFSRLRYFNTLAMALLMVQCMPAMSASGHHAVDDASIADEGFCQVELWHEYEPGRTLVHEGPACRVGPVEIGLNFDQLRAAGVNNRLGEGIQVKYATAFESPLNVGVLVGAYRLTNPGANTLSLLVPVTWQISSTLAMHVNLGRNWNRQSENVAQKGVSLEWAATPQWQFVGEWFTSSPVIYKRVGVRYAFDNRWSWDVSYAGSKSSPWWTTGLTWTFAR